MAMVHAHLRSWVLVCPSKRRKNPQVVVDAAGAVSQPQHGREASTEIYSKWLSRRRLGGMERIQRRPRPTDGRTGRQRDIVGRRSPSLRFLSAFR